MNILQNCSMANKPRSDGAKAASWLPALFLLLAASAVLSICLGAAPVTLRELFQVLLGAADPESAAYRIVLFVRLPRTLSAMLAGGALAVSGAIIQAVLNNALASPNIIGVNSGAGLFALLCMALFPHTPYLQPVAAFLGALVAALLVYAVAMKTGASRITIVLTGVALGSILSAGINAVTILYPEAIVGASGFMMGGFASVTWGDLRFAAGYILTGFLASLLLAHEMNVLNLGEDTAATLGMNVGLYRFLLIAAAAVLAGAAVSLAGLLGFVGLLVPHGARMLVGNDSRFLIPACMLLGAAFVTACDFLARVLFAPYELPAGIIMSFLGGPFFLYLLLKQRRKINA